MRISDWSSDVCSSDLAGHRRDAGFLALEVERRRARCDLQLRQLGQQVEDFLGDAVAEVFVLGVATHVDEGQYGNGAAVAGLARRRSEEHTSELQSLMRNSYAVLGLKKTKKQ